jgi:hypothetical protein
MNSNTRRLKEELFLVRKELNIFLVDVGKHEGCAIEMITQPIGVVSEVPRVSPDIICGDGRVVRDLLC